MAINANHPFEELNGVRCAVVEKNCSPERVKFLTYILEGNGFEVMSMPSPPPKDAIAIAETFTVGVTDVTFNVTNAIYGRLLRSPDGHVVTMAFWQQKEDASSDEIPYYDWPKLNA